MDAKDLRKLLEETNDKVSIFANKEILKQYNFNGAELISLINDFLIDEQKERLLEYEHLKDLSSRILKTFSDERKIEIILRKQYKFNYMDLIRSLGIEALVNFIRDNREYLRKNNIMLYRITKTLDKEKKLELISKLEDMGLSLEEKRQILATLDKGTKSKIDTSKFPEEYITALQMQISDNFSEEKIYGKIIVDFEKDLETYRGLDKLIGINPMHISSQDKAKLFKLCEICPEIELDDDLRLATSSAEEYIKAEVWIESVLGSLKERWTDIQKIAFIDNAIGKKISYTPNYGTESYNELEARALWKIINSGYGVCNGIAQIEKYMLSKIGIEAEKVSSGKHAFLKLKNIEMPNKKGELSKGDTIIDPTWNLSAHRYGGYPNNFCRSYEEIRKNDIRDDGTDSGSHKNDEQLASGTLELDEQSLRKVFTSIGIADREGDFPIKNLIDKSKIIDDYNLPEDESIKKQLELLSKYCPEFATCQNSTAAVLEAIILNQENSRFNRCIVKRVYEKADEMKEPLLFIFVEFPQAGKSFYLADKETNQFIEMSQNEFELKYDCYESDIQRNGGHRFWEDVEEINKEDLNQSSGKVTALEGEGR